jgi:hypothetical protein
VSLRGQLSDQIREIGYCRVRLNELLQLFGVAGGMSPIVGRQLFPAGANSLENAIEQLDSGVKPADLLQLDQRLQVLIRKQFRALVHVCLSSSNLLRTLAPALLQETEGFLDGRLAAADVAETYLAQHDEADLARVFEEAAPELGGAAAARELCILAAPPGVAETTLRQLLKEQVDERADPMELRPAVSDPDEILLYRERPLRLNDLEQLGPLGQEAYRQMSAGDHFTPHSRCDVSFQ